MNPLPVFIAEDEPLGRRRLADFIAGVSWVSLVGEAGDGAAAVEGILRLRPAIVFLDIRMPELSGLDVVDRLRVLDPAPAIVFTTAYDQYAVTAFELGAVDYLLKPFGEQRFITALQRARRVAMDHGGAAALQRARQALATDAAAPLGHILVRDTAGAIVPLALAEIDHVQAQDDNSVLHAGGRHYLVGVRLQDLEVRLPSPSFLRIHRSFLVNLDHVERMIPSGDGRFAVKLRTGPTLPASRARSQEIRRLAR
jgi:two-component system, LytTR family, response regulator